MKDRGVEALVVYPSVRLATRTDIPAMHRVRQSVRENRLNFANVTEADYLPAIEQTGRGWVAEDEGAVIGFAIGNARTGNIWALFVHPDHEARGHGRRLHDAMVSWLLEQGLSRLSLSTAPGTRAQRFYESAGWRYRGLLHTGEAHYEFHPMALEVTDAPSEADEQFVIEQTRAYNRRFTARDVRRLCVFARGNDGSIIGGLSGMTYWQYLEVSYLWVGEEHRGSGHASRIMAAAEAEAIRRGCKHAVVDTFSFQALGFYLRLGYLEFGRLSGFSGEHERHYLHKALNVDA
jgi:GNAT superfamily N-acetyltransferase